MKKTRRWLAMLLAVVLVSSNVIYQLGTNMSASESDSTTEAQQQDDSAEEKAQQDAASNAHKKDSGEAKVQEVNTEEDKNTSDTSKKTQAAEKTEKKQEQTAKKADTVKKANAAKKADTSSGDTKKDSEEKAYKATIQKSKLDGGDIKAWGSDGKKETVAYTDSKYMKEVKEGDSFNFEITVKNSFKLDKVTDQNNNTIQPKKVDGNVYTYKIADVKSDKTFHVLYKEETNSKKNDSDNAKSDNKKDDADASDDGESDSKANEDKNVSAASENGKIATVADTDTEKTIHVGNSVTLDTKLESMWPTTYTHKWSVNPTGIVSLDSYNSSKVVVTGVKVGDVTVTDNYTKSTWAGESKGSKSYTVHVRSAVSPTGISITGADKVTQFKTTQLKANLTPADASGNVTWTSSNEQILSVNDNGLVTAKRQGFATVTASVQGTAKATLSATKTIEVVKNESPTNKREALVYYLKDPTKDANSNASSEWGPSSIGTAVVNVEGATWTGNKNCFDNVDQRVVSWPTNLSGNVIPRSNNAWQLIFDAYKAKIERELGVTITANDVEEISLAPAKISKDNGTTPDMHLDCNVNIKCKKVALIKYYLFDANGTNWEMLGSKNYLVKDGSTTKPSDVTSKDFPTTKTVNGVTYTFSGWYTDQSLTTPAPSFPAQVTGAANYYAKYVAGYQVMYNLAGGKFRDGSTTATEKHNVDTDVVVKEQPTRAGYKFKGWKVEGLSGTTTINSGETFTMPNGNVTLTAQWEKKDITDYVTLTTKDVTEVYDGQSHAVGEATAVAKDGKENEVGTLTVEYQKADKSWTTNREEITAKDVSDSKTVNVRVTSTDLVGELTGTEKLTITKRDVTLTSASDEKVYDGQPLTNKNVTASTGKNEGFVEGEGAAYKVSGTITNVGEKENTFTYTLNENTKEENYNITSKTGKLKVTPVTTEVKVKITGHQNSVTYDGTEHKVTGYDVTEISNKLYTADDFTFSGKAEAVGTDAKAYPMGLKTSQFKNKNANFTNVTFEVVDGSLTINPRNVTLTSATDSKVYDKTPLTNDTITVGGDKFVEGEGATYDVTGSQTEVGTSDNTFGYTLKDGTKAGNYNISKAEGKLTVTADENEIVVNIVGNTKTEKYNGKEQSVTDYTVESIQSNGKAYSKYTEDDFSFSGKAEAKGTDAGSYNMGLKASDFTNTNKNFTKVTFVVTDGKLTIEKRNVTLTSADATKEYDGTPLTSNEITVGGEDRFVGDEGVTYTVTGAQTEVGSSANSFTYIAKDGTNLENYNITKTEGTLTVKKNDTLEVTVYITGHTDSKMYNGKEQFVTDYDVTTSNGLYTTNDFEFKGTAKAAGTDAGDYAMGLKESDFTNTSKNFSKVKFEITDGNLTITKRDVTLKTADAEKVYDGTALTKDGVTVGGDGFVKGEGATYKVNGTITNVGEKPNAFTYKLKDNTKAKNYNITETPGTLKVTPVTDKVTVTIKENNENAKYDGNEHTDSGYTVKSISNNLYTANDFTFSGKAEVKGTDAGTYDMDVKATDFKNTNDNFSNVEFVVEDGQLIISQRKVTLTSGSAEKVYDGTALTKDEVTVSGDGFVKGEGAEYNVTGSQTKAGSSDNEFTYTLKDNTKKDNYNITVVKGTLTVTQDKNEVVVTITGHTNSVKYDGKDHTAEGYDVSINNKKYHESDFTFNGTKVVTKKDAGTYPMGLKVSDFTNNSTDFEKVTFVVTDGSLAIAKRTVTLGSATASKVYDGTALTSKDITVGGDGFAKGEGATYDVTGSQTAVGSSDNTFTYERKENTKADNYTITTSVGTLAVTAQSITPDPDNPDSYKGITINDPSDHVYDGQEHKWSPKVIDANKNALTEGTDYTVSYKYGTEDKNFKDVQTITVTITGQGNYKGTVTKTYKITKRKVKLTSASDQKVYDGQPLTNKNVTASTGKNEGFVSGEGATYDVTGSQTTVGSSANEFTYTLNANTKADNYEITTEEGTLTVTSDDKEVVVTIKGNTKTEQYDGTAKTVSGYEIVSISNNLYKVSDIHFAKATTEVTKTNAGEYPMGLTAADFSNVNDNFSKVTFVVTDGKLTITKRDVTLTSATDEKVYDGTALTNDKVTVSGDGFAAGEGATYDVTGSQTKVGSSKNNFTIKKLTGNEENYNFTKVPGTLTVTEQSITPGPDPGNPDPSYKGITVDDPSDHVYDGQPHKWNPTVEDAKGKALEKDKDYTVSYDKDNFKDVTTITVTITGKGDYKGTITKKYQITPRPVTLTSATDSKAYDGDPLTNKKVTESKGTDEGFVDDEGASYDVTGSQTEVGTSDNTFTYTLNTKTKKENYTITKVEGKLTVTPDENTVVVTIVGNKVSDTYDGTEKTAAGYKVTDISNTNKKKYTEADIQFSGKAEVKKTDAGSYEMGLKETDFTNGNKNFKNVKFVVTDGKLDIAKREVTMTSASDQKVYDGKALTNKDVTAVGFVDGEGASYDVTGSQTAVGSSKNKFDYKLNDGTKAGNYTITKVEGTLEVTPQSITPDPDPENPDSYKGITINDPSDHIYDGEAHKWAPEVKDKDGNALREGTDYEVSYDKDNFTDVSTIKVTIKGTGNYTGTVTKEYKITPRPVTLTSADAEKVYDGKALTKKEVTASKGENEGFVKNDGADYDVTGTQTVVGTSKNTFGYTLKSGTLAKNYTITKVEGTLEVTPVTDKVTVVIQENSGKFTYDGTEKTVKGYEVESISNKLYSENDFSFSGKDTVKGTDAGTYDMELAAKDFANNNANFSNVEFIIKHGTLKIDKKDVTLTSASATKMYDGKALTKEEVTAEGFVGNDGATYKVTGSQTEVGKSDNTFTYELKKGTNPDNYNITKKNGELEVTPSDQKIVVTIKENSGKETYDGTEKTVTGYTVENISSKLPYTEKDFKFNGDATVKGTNAGTYNMELKPGDFKNINKNFSNVSFEIIDGTLTIAKRDVTLTSASDNKAYDGTALENKNVTAEGFVGNDGATYNVTGSQTEVGSSDNTFTYELNKGTNKDNYNIKTVNGKLTVTENADEIVVTITEKSGTVKYDGKEHTVKGYDVTNISNKLYTEKDFTFSGDATVKGTNAGTYNMEVKAGDFKNTNKNFSKVKFVIVDGTLTIEKRTVIMTSASQNKVYDGKALTNKDVTETGDGFVKGEGASYDVTGSQTNVGKSDNEFTYKLNKDTSKDNYTIETNKGTLEVTPVTTAVKVTIKENGGTFKYDGEKKAVTGYTVKAITNPLYTEDDFTFGGTASVEGTNAGTYDMEVKAADFKNISKNFTNVTFEVEDDQLVIEKRKVTLTSATDKKVYDGTALKNNEVTVTGDGFAANEGAAYDVTGSQTNVGESDNAFTYVLNKGTDAKNYEITKTEGKLTVTPVTDKVTVVVKENSDTVKYDGTTKSVIGYTVKSISNPLYQTKDFTFSGDASVNGTDAGTYDMEVKASDFANISKNFTNVEFKVEDGTLTIEKRKVTLTSASDEKVYDGKALTNAQVDVGGDGFATGEGASYDVTGSQTNVGSSDNTFTYELNSGTNSKNYTITTKEGTLKVTPVTDSVVVKVKENSGTEKYDGTKKTVEGYTVTSISNPLYTEKDFEFNGTAKVSGTNAGEYDMEVKASDFANISKNFTNVTFEVGDGKLIIEKRNVTLTSASDSKAYDGKALKNDTVTVSDDGFAKDEGASYDVTGSQLNVGTSDNTFTYELNANTKADNYNIELVEGKLTVTADENEVVVTITENRGRNKYDGRKHKVTGYEVTAISNKLYTEKDFTFNGKAEVTGTDAGTYNMNVKAADFKNTNANFDKVTFVIIDGTLTIEKRNVTMTSANASKQYNGRALTSNKVTVSGDGFAKGEGATYDVTGTRTNTGTSKNTFTYTLKNGTKAANYNIKKVEGKLTITTASVTSNTPNTQANPTPQNRNVVQRVVTSVRNVPSRIARAVQETGAKVRELVNAGDDNVPLGNQKLDDHKCCVLHFLIMLLTAILYGFFTHNLKKRQKKLFEVREELDTELAKRGLPTTKEQKQQ